MSERVERYAASLYGLAGALTQVNASAYVDFPDIAE